MKMVTICIRFLSLRFSKHHMAGRWLMRHSMRERGDSFSLSHTYIHTYTHSSLHLMEKHGHELKRTYTYTVCRSWATIVRRFYYTLSDQIWNFFHTHRPRQWIVWTHSLTTHWIQPQRVTLTTPIHMHTLPSHVHTRIARARVLSFK